MPSGLGTWLLPAFVFLACAARGPESTPRTEAGRSSAPAAPTACDVALERVLGQLPDTVSVRAYAETPESAARMERTLGQLAKAGKDRFRYLVSDLRQEAARRAAEKDGVNRDGIVIAFRGELQHVSSANFTAAAVAQRVRHLMLENAGKLDRVGVVSDKRDLGMQADLVPRASPDGKLPTIDGILHQAFPFYRFDAVPVTGSQPIDPTLPGLFVTQPEAPYSRAELEKLDDFLMRGDKTLVLYVSAFVPKREAGVMIARFANHGLDELLTGYGLVSVRDVLFDFAAPAELGIKVSGSPSAFLYPGVSVARRLHATLDADFPSFRGIDELAFPFPSSLEIVRGRQPDDVNARALARTSKHAASERREPVDFTPRAFDEWPRSRPEGQVPIAVVVEGRLKSAFSERRAPRPSRLLLISSGLFLANPFAHTGNRVAPSSDGSAPREESLALAGAHARAYLTMTILSVKQTLDWMTLGDLRSCP